MIMVREWSDTRAKPQNGIEKPQSRERKTSIAQQRLRAIEEAGKQVETLCYQRQR
jgi:hypothetical protein